MILQPSPGRYGTCSSYGEIIGPINHKKKTETVALKYYSSGFRELRQQAETNMEAFGLYVFCEICKIRLYQLFKQL